MSKILLKNGYVLITSDSQVEKLDIFIDNGEIKEIFKNGDLPDFILLDKDVFVYDLSNKLITPGLINTHTHVAMSHFKSMADDLSFKEWLYDSMLPREDLLKTEYIYNASFLSMLEMISNGITCFADMFMFVDETAKAVVNSGMRAYLSRGLAFDTPEGWKRRIDENLASYEKYNGYDNRIYIGFGPHAPYTVDLEHLKEVGLLAKKLDSHIQIHLLEAAWEKSQYSLKDIENTGLFANPTIAAHCVNLDEDDIKVLSVNRVNVSHNPCSNLKLGNGAAPIVDLLKHNINVTLGTDGSASNNSLDIMKEMYVAGITQKSKYSPESIKTVDLLRMVWDNAAFALNEKIGRIEKDYKADLTVFDLNCPEFFPFDFNRLKSHLVYSASSKNVWATMINGVWKYYDKKFVDVEVDKIYEKFQFYYEKLEDDFNRFDNGSDN